ncbi:MAG: ABC transporter permease [Anaerolineales bacterium]|nr:ABC transporter permease [Anaerolineales bacterium]
MLSESRGGRLFQYVIVLVVAISLNFFLPRFMPGNPLALLAGVDVGQLTPEQRAEVMAEAGLDRPLHEQYLKYWGDLLQGDFGYSYRQREPITDLILARLPWTLLLAGASLIVAAVIGIAAGAFSAWRRAGKADVGLLWGMITVNSLPSFWLGMLLISVVSVRFGLLPSFGAETPASGYEGLDRAIDIGKHAILPVLTLTVLTIPGVYLVMRYTMLGNLGSDYIRTARAKGAGESRVMFAHAMRNSLAPVVTVLALNLGFAFGGTVVVETVFSYPGLGRLIFESVGGRDYPVMQAAFLLFTIAVLLCNLLADFLYQFLDPRTKSG